VAIKVVRKGSGKPKNHVNKTGGHFRQ